MRLIMPNRARGNDRSVRIARSGPAGSHAINPAHEIPPRGVLAVPRRRPAPYLFSTEDLARILEAARLLRPPLRAASYQTLFGLLAACGMRVGEALTLTGDDVNLDEGLLTIRARQVRPDAAGADPPVGHRGVTRLRRDP